MKLERSNKNAWIVIALGLALAASPIMATVCNTGACRDGLVQWIKVASDGQIWFVVDNADQLENLVPADGCNVSNVWTGAFGGAQRALYIRNDDPERDEKYTMLLTAFTTGAKVGFAPIKDPASTRCALDVISVH